MHHYSYIIAQVGLCLWATLIFSCQAASPIPAHKAPRSLTANSPAGQPASRTDWPAANQPLAFVAGKPVTAAALLPRLIEQGGGEILTEVVLDQMLETRLAERGLIISQDRLADERQALLAELSDDSQEAQRLLLALQRRRGMSRGRFDRTLWRNAALRALSQPAVQVTEAQLRQAFDMQYGPLYEVRLITTPTLAQTRRILAQLADGATFIDLAIAQSTDPSGASGGLLEPLSPADGSYPAAIRNAIIGLEVGQVSHPIAIESGYALVRLERKIAGQQVKFDDVKEALLLSVQRQEQQLQMRQLARTLLGQADVVVLDAALKESWDRQKEQMQPSNP